MVDFGSASVTGILVSTIENLRKYYGLKHKPVRLTDPYQMLGEVDDELIEIMGVDAFAACGRKNGFGFYNHEPFKEYPTPWGQTVLVPEGFRTTKDAYEHQNSNKKYMFNKCKSTIHYYKTKKE